MSVAEHIKVNFWVTIPCSMGRFVPTVSKKNCLHIQSK
jgi:hypothetical protein